MKPVQVLFGAGMALALLPSIAIAESCEEKFVRLLVEGNGDVPTKTIITQQMQGGMTTVNEFRMDGEGNWITEMIDPPTMPWSMVRDKIMYTSSDKGETWTKIRDVSGDGDGSAARAKLREDAKTLRDASCTIEQMDGGIAETVSGTYTSSALQGAEVTNTWWLTSDGWIARHSSSMRGGAVNMDIEQVLERVDSVEIPAP